MVKMPDGKPFAIHITVEGEARPVMTRAGSMIAQEWRQFGIDASTTVAQGMLDRRAAGDFEVVISWSVETWGGHRPVVLPRQLALAVRGAARQPTAAARLAALVNPELDKIIEQIRTILRRSEGHRTGAIT